MAFCRALLVVSALCSFSAAQSGEGLDVPDKDLKVLPAPAEFRSLWKPKDFVPRDPAKLAKGEFNRKEATRKAVCAFGVIQAADFVARAALSVKGMISSCPQSVKDSAAYKPGEQMTPKSKKCFIATNVFITSLSQIAAGLSVASDKCQQDVKIEALCAAPSAALFTPLTQFMAGSTVISAACNKAAMKLPSDVIDSFRRLSPDAGASEGAPVEFPKMKGTGRQAHNFTKALKRALVSPIASVGDDGWDITPENRKWEIAACVTDAVAISMAIGQLALGFNSAVRACPENKNTPAQQRVTSAACTADVAFAIFSFARFVNFAALASEHCAPGNQPEAICVAGVAALMQSIASVTSNGAFIYLNCVIGEDKNPIIKGEFEKLQPDLDLVRRLQQQDETSEINISNVEGWMDDLFLGIGYNLSDSEAPWLKDIDTESHEFIDEGLKTIVNMQTYRESSAGSEDFPAEPLASEVPTLSVDLENESETLACSEMGVVFEPFDMLDQPMTSEASAMACQARCAGITGCAHYSYWRAAGHCHVVGILGKRRTTSYAGNAIPDEFWVSGPPGCQKGQISEASHLIIKRHESCYHPHALYKAKGEDAPPTKLSSALHCQQLCQKTQGCRFFSFSSMNGDCHLTGPSGYKVQPVMYFVAGPKSCPLDVIGDFTKIAKFGATWPYFLTLSCVFASLVFGFAVLTTGRRAYSLLSHGMTNSREGSLPVGELGCEEQQILSSLETCQAAN